MYFRRARTSQFSERLKLLKLGLTNHLTVASCLGIFVASGSFLTIFFKGDMPAQNCFHGLPLKFQCGTFDAIKIFEEKFFTGSSTGYKPEISMSKGDYETSGSPWLYSYFSLNLWMLSTSVMSFQAHKCLKTTQLLREKRRNC